MPDLAATSAAVAAPAYKDEATTANNQKASLLQAIAQSGSAGRAQFQAQQAQTAQDQQNALKATAQREAVIQNMPTALAAQLGAQTSTPFDMRQANTAASQQTQANNLASASAQAGNYMGEVAAAAPVAQAQTQSKVAALQDAANQKVTSDNLAKQLAQAQLDNTVQTGKNQAAQAAATLAQTNAANASGKNDPNALMNQSDTVQGQAVSDMIDQLKAQYAQQNPGSAAVPGTDASLAANLKLGDPAGNYIPGKAPVAAVAGKTLSDDAALQYAAAKLKMNPNVARSLLEANKAAGVKTAQTSTAKDLAIQAAQESVNTNKPSTGMLSDAAAGIKSGMSGADLAAAMAKNSPNASRAAIQSAVAFAVANQ